MKVVTGIVLAWLVTVGLTIALLGGHDDEVRSIPVSGTRGTVVSIPTPEGSQNQAGYLAAEEWILQGFGRSAPTPQPKSEYQQQHAHGLGIAGERFVAGYRAWQGRPEWEQHFLQDVLPCEGSRWVGYYGPFISRAQFDPGSWRTAVAATGLGDPDDPFHVGANVAWWSNAISHPGDRSGWPTCWWVGVVP